MMSERSIAGRDAEVIPRFTGADSKACFPFFAMYAAGGSRFPLMLVANGRSGRCHKQFCSLGYLHEVLHSPSGWCHKDLVVDYLC
jgi:hypothetical protein